MILEIPKFTKSCNILEYDAAGCGKLKFVAAGCNKFEYVAVFCKFGNFPYHLRIHSMKLK